MAKKMNENDLNNVSGGCGLSDSYYAKFNCYNKNGDHIKYVESEHFSKYDDAKKAKDDKIASLFAEDINIHQIIYTIYCGGHERASGSRFRK